MTEHSINRDGGGSRETESNEEESDDEEQLTDAENQNELRGPGTPLSPKLNVWIRLKTAIEQIDLIRTNHSEQLQERHDDRLFEIIGELERLSTEYRHAAVDETAESLHAVEQGSGVDGETER